MSTRSDKERERIDALRALDILGTQSEAHLDAVCLIAARLYDVPIALVTLIDETTVWLISSVGVTAASVPRDDAFCNETIEGATGSALVVSNLADDDRYRDNVLVTSSPNVRFYAGVPIALRSGLNIGTLCVMDTVARPDFGDKQRQELFALARIVEGHLRLHEARLHSETEEQRYRLLAENTTDIIIRSDLDTTRRYVSPAARSVLGYEPEELIGTKPLTFVHPDDADAFARILDDLMSETIDQATCCQRYRHKEGRWIWIEASFSLTRDLDRGTATGLVASLRDVSDRKAVEDALRLSEERLALAIEGGSDGLWDWNIASGEVRVSGSWRSILGYQVDEIEPKIQAWNDLVHPEDAGRSQRLLIEHLKGTRPKLECEYRVKTKTGAFVWTLARGKVVARDARGRAVRMVGTHTDITQRKEADKKIAHMAMHDALTGLPNRTLFRERLDQEIGNAERHGYVFAVLAFDLDDFKLVNDTLGHPAGDLLLRTVAERLKTVTRAGDTVARLGGDEFAIVLTRLWHAQDAAAAACRAIAALEAPFDLGGHQTKIGVSIGIAVSPKHGKDADQLFKNADIALYRAKAAGRNTYRFYESGMDILLAKRARLEAELREAVSRGDFILHYQPIVNVGSGDVEGFEALLRWRHPTLGLVPPSDFMAIAEDTGLIIPIGEWALREACSEAAAWPDHIRIAVNVSAVQFQQPGLEQSVMLALASSGLPAARLDLEVTESALMRDATAAITSLHRLRRLGVRIALDDFGTGYSSLSYLRQFPFDKIKIDQSFVREIAHPDTAAIVQAVVGLAKRAGAAITAEGVETHEQFERVKQEGCTEVQGFLFSKPLTADEARRSVIRPASHKAA